MKTYSASELRNVAVVGHNTVGKTTLVAALLYSSGATTRPGRIEEGTCPTDFDGEEIERQISINLSVAHAIHRDVPFTKAMTAAVRHEVTELASWLGLDPDPAT